MKKARRIPRKIGSDDEGDARGSREGIKESSAVHAAESSTTISFVKRPSTKSAPRKHTTLRASYNDNEENEDTDSAVPVIVKRPNIARRALDRAAQEDRLPLRTDEDRPSYSKDFLAELRKSTPATPVQNIYPTRDDSAAKGGGSNGEIDMISKFGHAAAAAIASSTSLALPTSTDSLIPAIPTDAEIREKKERRRRLAKEQDFISLDARASPQTSNAGSDIENDTDYQFVPHLTRSLIIPAEEINLRHKYGETRLEHEDEDIAEGFESFVEDAGKVTLSHAAAKEQERARRNDIAKQIKGAQHGYGYGADVDSEDDRDGNEDGIGEEVDEEEIARNAAYEAAQTRAGTFSAGGIGVSSHQRRENEREERLRRRLEVQPKIRPIPEVKVLVGGFWERVREKEEAVLASRRALERVIKEAVEIEGEEVRQRELLVQAGERFGALTKAGEEKKLVEAERDREVGDNAVKVNGDEEDGKDESEGEERPGLGGAGFANGTMTMGLGMESGMNPMGLGLGMQSFSGMWGIPRDEDDRQEEEEAARDDDDDEDYDSDAVP